jgi:RNA polymerase sigma-70 factor (ECF subfamily)
MSDDGKPSAPPSGDVEALARLLEEHAPQLRTMLQRRLDPTLSARISADDLLSDTFLRARERLVRGQVPDGVPPYLWLYGIARDCLIDAWRRNTSKGRDVDREMPWPERSSIQMGLGLCDSGTSPSSGAARAEMQRHMQQALTRLSDRDREILWMRYYDQLTFAEAAAVLEIKESAAKLRHLRAIERLGELWKEEYGRAGGSG